VLDLGTGSGAIALAVKQACTRGDGDRRDASPAALAVAERNARRLALDVAFVEGSWWQGLGERRFDRGPRQSALCPRRRPALEALRHEPRMALASGEDGLAALREIVARAPAHLEAGGWLSSSTASTRPGSPRLPRRRRLEAVETRADLAGHPRATGGRTAGRSPVR
jgi:release factor glutamine methyltransferase